MNILFELFATLGLDSTDFKEQAEAALDSGDNVADQITKSFETVDAAAAEADTRLDDVQSKSSITQGILQGFADATQDVVQDAIKGILEFGAQSIEAAAGTGSAMAQSFLDAQSEWDLNLQALKVKAGNVLLPAATFFTEVANSIAGITAGDRLLIMLDQIDSYSFENLRALEDSLSGVFGLFDTASIPQETIVDENGEVVSLLPDVGGMTAGLESQAAYWQEYADTLENLRSRNIDPQFLSDIADGTAESLANLKAIETADATQLNALITAYESVQETKAATAANLNEMQLQVDQDLAAMVESVNSMVASMNPEEAYNASNSLANSVANGLADAYPSISSWVSSINAELASIGAGFQPQGYDIADALNQSFSMNEMGFNRFNPHASGLSYVPYDDYPAALHAGEAVLTRQDADEWRSGSRSSAEDIAALRGEILALGDRIASMAVYLGRDKVGSVLSRDMAKESRSGRRYGV